MLLISNALAIASPPIFLSSPLSLKEVRVLLISNALPIAIHPSSPNQLLLKSKEVRVVLVPNALPIAIPSSSPNQLLLKSKEVRDRLISDIFLLLATTNAFIPSLFDANAFA